MQLPFTVEQFLGVFKSYNETVFPLQIIFYFIAFFCVYLLYKPVKFSSKFISWVLTFFWLWIGIVYHIIFFSPINKPAYIFGIFFIAQGILFFHNGIIKDKLAFENQSSVFNYVGIVFIIYALIIYPVIGHVSGHQYPSSPTFGLPCPTTIFTFGILLFIREKIPAAILIIPLIWSVIGFSAALKLSITEDLGLLVAGVTGFVLLLIRSKKKITKSLY